MTSDAELHVVALSGGKDSTAMALRLAEVEPRDYVYICTPTGDELPEMFAHWRRLSDLLGKPLTPIMGGTLKSIISDENMLPNWRARFCTRRLKIEPYAAWLMQRQSQYDRIVSYVGLRADEEERAGGDYSKIPNIEMRYPMREWGWRLADVLNYLDERGADIPKRTDCARCFFQGVREWWLLYKDYPDIYEDAVQDEKRIGHTYRSPGRDTWPAALDELRTEFERGRIPKGAQQIDLIGQMKCRVCRL